jgi:hypothetical protein
MYDPKSLKARPNDKIVIWGPEASESGEIVRTIISNSPGIVFLCVAGSPDDFDRVVREKADGKALVFVMKEPPTASIKFEADTLVEMRAGAPASVRKHRGPRITEVSANPSPLRVSELIRLLSACDPDAVVCVHAIYDPWEGSSWEHGAKTVSGGLAMPTTAAQDDVEFLDEKELTRRKSSYNARSRKLFVQKLVKAVVIR